MVPNYSAAVNWMQHAWLLLADLALTRRYFELPLLDGQLVVVYIGYVNINAPGLSQDCRRPLCGSICVIFVISSATATAGRHALSLANPMMTAISDNVSYC